MRMIQTNSWVNSFHMFYSKLNMEISFMKCFHCVLLNFTHCSEAQTAVPCSFIS